MHVHVVVSTHMYRFCIHVYVKVRCFAYEIMCGDLVPVLLLTTSQLIASSTELTPEQIESEEESGAECAHNPVFDVELATSFSCVAVCPDFGNYSEPSPESGTCYGK